MPMTCVEEKAVDSNPQLLNQVKVFNEEFYRNVREQFLQVSTDYLASTQSST